MQTQRHTATDKAVVKNAEQTKNVASNKPQPLDMAQLRHIAGGNRPGLPRGGW